MQTIRLGTSQRPAWLAAGALAIAAAGIAAVPMLSDREEAMTTPTAESNANTAPRRPTPSAPTQSSTASTAPKLAAPHCADCATVVSVRAVQEGGQASGLGGVAGGVIGAALGNQVGKGDGRTAARIVGAVGGAVVGHQAEKQFRRHTVHEVQLRMADGQLRTLRYEQAPSVRPGDSVRLDGNRLVVA